MGSVTDQAVSSRGRGMRSLSCPQMLGLLVVRPCRVLTLRLLMSPHLPGGGGGTPLESGPCLPTVTGTLPPSVGDRASLASPGAVLVCRCSAVRSMQPGALCSRAFGEMSFNSPGTGLPVPFAYHQGVGLTALLTCECHRNKIYCVCSEREDRWAPAELRKPHHVRTAA